MAITKQKMLNSFSSYTNSGIAANSLALTTASFLTRNASGFIEIADGPTDRIIGVNDTFKTFSSTNQTTDRKRVEYKPICNNIEYVVDISGGTVTVADEGKLFFLASVNVIDGASKVSPTATATTAATQINGQFELVQFISATSGVFRIFNK